MEKLLLFAFDAVGKGVSEIEHPPQPAFLFVLFDNALFYGYCSGDYQIEVLFNGKIIPFKKREKLGVAGCGHFYRLGKSVGYLTGRKCL